MEKLEQLKNELAATIRHYNLKGWSPATSTNYSFKFEDCIYVSRSGIDKAHFHADDFITVNQLGEPIGNSVGLKPSAETLIHCVLYELFPETKVILHSHSVYPLLISNCNQEAISFEGYEVQKGFEGQITHEAIVQIPIFENTQDMDVFSEVLRSSLKSINHFCFIMRKHGTYAWGKNLFEAKRHLETLEYLCQCEYMMNK
ncbi:MAG: methylthioribulose 1-phosphate dehydratase [Flavobacteriia bacterium]|nr:methylthioribulose 1-phosphate dehydratase [Flavobacteriia bacterium]